MRWLFLMLLLPAAAMAGEDCSMLNGSCREVCTSDEEAVKGAFLDCSDKQECCVRKQTGKDADKPSPLESKDSDRKPEPGK